MKNLFKIAMFAAGTFMISPAFAQTHKDSTIGHKISRAAKKVGPGNHTVYIDEHDKYYYVNKKGHRVYVKKSQLIDKPEK